MMKEIMYACAAIAGLLAVGGLRADQAKEAAAVKAAEAWVSLVDAGEFGQSWEEASSLFKRAVSQAQWEKQVQAARGPLGAVKSRTKAAASYTRELPGVPDGEYVVIQFQTSFENKDRAVETITPMLDEDGAWRVSGYFIR